MEILSEEEMAARIDFKRPLKPEPEDAIPPRQSVYSIPFEYGENPRGTVISIAKAREIAAELRAEIAEFDKREVFRALKQEQARSKSFGQQLSAKNKELFEAMSRIALLEQRLRARSKKARRA